MTDRSRPGLRRSLPAVLLALALVGCGGVEADDAAAPSPTPTGTTPTAATTPRECPVKAVPGQVPVATLDRLTLIYAAAVVICSTLAALCYVRFPFGRREHELRMARLAGAPEIDSAPRNPLA